MELNRQIIKNQAKSLIKGKVIPLFLVYAIVFGMLTSGLWACYGAMFGIVFSTDDNAVYDSFTLDPDDDFNGGYYDQPEWDREFFDDFTGGQITPLPTATVDEGTMGMTVTMMLLALVAVVITFVFSGLSIPLIGVFIKLVRGEHNTFGKNLKYVFKTYFDSNYFKRIILIYLTNLAVGYASYLLIIPGVILSYCWYFAPYVIAEKPGIGLSRAWGNSNKITKGHKWELFKLDLSFLGWYLLIPLTCGLAAIYVLPYITTTKALYYENFKIRALQEFKVSEVDFMTEDERNQQYYESIVNANKQAKVSDFGSNESVEYFNNLH